MLHTEVDQQLDSAPELPLELIKSRVVKGVAALTGRTFILQVIAFFATFFLTIFLTPSQYGVFFIVSAIINFFAYFSDVGLAAALVQKKEKLTELELRTTFTIQQGLVFTLVGLIFITTPLLKQFYHLDQTSIYLLWALAFSLILSSLKTIPSIILERKLDFNKLIIPQLLETLVFNAVAVYCAWKGFGVGSFTLAVLLRGIIGLIAMYLLQPWMPGIAFSMDIIKSLFRFGIPYQINTLLATVKDDGMTAFLGTILGSSGIGLLGWAQKWAFAPLRFFMDQVIRVTFPAFSRMQDNRAELGKALSKSIFFINLLVFPSVALLVTLAPLLTEIIPKYTKWQPALLALTLITINTMWAAVTTPLTNVLSAIGKIHITLGLMIMWTILTWLLIPALSIRYGVNGAALGYAIIGSSSVVAIIVARKYVEFDLWNSTYKVLFSAGVMGIILELLRSLMPVNVLGITVMIGCGLLVYMTLVTLLSGHYFIQDLKKIFRTVK